MGRCPGAIEKWLCLLAKPYCTKYRRLLESALLRSTLSYAVGILDGQKHGKDAIHVGYLSILDRSEVLTRHVSLIWKENDTYPFLGSEIACSYLANG